MKSTRFFAFLTAAFVLCSSFVSAAELAIPHSFSPNTPALAAQVNGNFSAVQTAVNDNDARIAALESMLLTMQGQIATLQGTVTAQANVIAALQDNSVLALDDILELVTDPATGMPTARFSGVNLQVVNGTGNTNTWTGTGNLIVGYNETPGDREFCSSGSHQGAPSCTASGFTWAANQRSGSHNLILGNGNSYSRYGGLVAGWDNIINSGYSSVSGGTHNTASGLNSSVSGGNYNYASGWYSSVSGGSYNYASGNSSSVSGGYGNTASGRYSSVSGGNNRTAPGQNNWRAGSLLEAN